MTNSELKRVVLLGTGTDVGKTYVGRLLAQAWKEQVGSCLALKPVESGVVDVAADAAGLKSAATVGSEPCYVFAPPISPHLAARKVGVTVQLEALGDFVSTWEEKFVRDFPAPRLSLIETAGGAFSPLSTEHNNVDLAQALDPATWILVCPDALGVLHDLQATLRGMHRRLPDLIIFSESRGVDASTGTNVDEFYQVTLPQVQRALALPDYFPSVVRVPVGATAHDVGAQVLEALHEIWK